MKTARTDLCDNENWIMKGREFLRRLQRLARHRGSANVAMGVFGSMRYRTTLKDPKKELGTGLLRAMCREFGIEPRDLD
jgi:mRNA interferase HicA